MAEIAQIRPSRVAKGSPLANVICFLVVCGVILGFCGGVITVWVAR